MKVYYARGKCLKAISLMFYNDLTNKDIYTEPPIFGNEKPDENEVIDKCMLTLEKKEAIYRIDVKSERTTDFSKIIELNILTTYGQFIEVNQNCFKILEEIMEKDKPNLNKQDTKSQAQSSNNVYNCKIESKSFTYQFENKIFEGIYVGWTKSCISYFDFLTTKGLGIAGEKVDLLDQSGYDITNFNTEFKPLIKSDLYGYINRKSVINDDYFRLMDIDSSGKKTISSITVYHDKFINGIEIEYCDWSTGQKTKLKHIGTESKSNAFNNSIPK